MQKQVSKLETLCSTLHMDSSSDTEEKPYEEVKLGSDEVQGSEC